MADPRCQKDDLRHLNMIRFVPNRISAFLLMSCFCLISPPERLLASDDFKKIIVDEAGPVSPWGKSVGDIDNDGKTDIIVGGHSRRPPTLMQKLLSRLGIVENPWEKSGELYWYKNPDWQRNLISDDEHFRTDHEVRDINNDGKNDIISIADSGLMWFRNPDWEKIRIDTTKLHDIEVADFDGDGDYDIVARNQSLFGHDDGDILYFYRQDSPEKWVSFKVKISHGEGLAVADLNNDNLPDVVVNQKFYINPGKLEASSKWEAISYCPSWKWLYAFIDIADINDDGHPDILLSPAEPAGSYYRISWCENPADIPSQWNEHIVDSSVESVIHSVRAGDFNNDNRLDIVSAEMTQGEDPDEVNVYWHMENDKWQKKTVSTQGSHSMRVADFDGDGVHDFFGANWHDPYEFIELWLSKKKMKHGGDT